MAVVQQRSVVAAEGFDYADAFEVPMSKADARSAEQLVRAGLKGVPRWLGMVVLVAHRHVLRLGLAPGSSPKHVLGWEILTAEHDSIRLRATGPLLHGLLVARRVPPRVPCSRRSSATGDRCWPASSGRRLRPYSTRSCNISSGGRLRLPPGAK